MAENMVGAANEEQSRYSTEKKITQNRALKSTNRLKRSRSLKNPF
jgi:hypothetical protein